MLGSHRQQELYLLILEVSKPYRYARKSISLALMATLKMSFKTLQVCQEDSIVSFFSILLPSFKTLQVCQEATLIHTIQQRFICFKTLQVCQEGYYMGKLSNDFKQFQNLIGMLGRQLSCYKRLMQNFVSKPYRYARKFD